jgi:hypothetical protein
MSEPHWRWLTDLTFKCRDEVHPYSPNRALLEFQYQHLLQREPPQLVASPAD